jgi:hypothetical protein
LEKIHMVQVDPVLELPEAKRTVARPGPIGDDPGFSGSEVDHVEENGKFVEETVGRGPLGAT